MSRASLIGLVAAILLISSLIFGAMDIIVPKTGAITLPGVAFALGGFALVIVAAFVVVAEERVLTRQIDDELRDVSMLAEEAGGGVAGRH